MNSQDWDVFEKFCPDFFKKWGSKLVHVDMTPLLNCAASDRHGLFKNELTGMFEPKLIDEYEQKTDK